MTTTQTTFIKTALALVVLAGVSAISFSVAHGDTGGASGRADMERTQATSPFSDTVPAGAVLGTSDFQFTTDLSGGMAGNDVTELQERLRLEGFFTYPTASGFFGPVTKAAVVAYQQAKGITPSAGYVGPMTRASLNK